MMLMLLKVKVDDLDGSGWKWVEVDGTREPARRWAGRVW